MKAVLGLLMLTALAIAPGKTNLLSGAAVQGGDTKDITITFAHPPEAAPPDGGGLPHEALYPPGATDGKEYGPFAKIVAHRISGVSVTWSDPQRFKTEEQTAALLTELLSSTSTRTYTAHAWSYGDGVPSLVATVDHTTGKTGRWIVWCPPISLDWAYQDENGKWWWGLWDRLKAPMPKSCGTVER